MAVFPFLGEIHPFAAGVFGSLAIEVVAGVRACTDLDGKCPPRYKRAAYLIFRSLLALCGGALPVFLDANTALNALYLGASAPLFLDRLGKGIAPTPTDENGSA